VPGSYRIDFFAFELRATPGEQYSRADAIFLLSRFSLSRLGGFGLVFSALPRSRASGETRRSASEPGCYPLAILSLIVPHTFSRVSASCSSILAGPSYRPLSAFCLVPLLREEFFVVLSSLPSAFVLCFFSKLVDEVLMTSLYGLSVFSVPFTV